MPITQDRMIALLNAALDYQHAFNQSKAVIISQAKAAERHQIAPSEALTNILNFTDHPEAFLSRAIETTKVIAVEHHHFKTHARDNRRAARRAERKRREAGIGPALHASPQLYHEPLSYHQSSERVINDDINDWNSPDPTSSSEDFQLDGVIGQQDAALDKAAETIKRQIAEISLSPAQKRQFDIDAANALYAPFHASRVRAGATSAEDLLACSCGFTGPLDAWQQHITDLGEATT